MEANKKFDDTLKGIFPMIRSNYLAKTGSKMPAADNVLAEKQFLEEIYEIICSALGACGHVCSW